MSTTITTGTALVERLLTHRDVVDEVVATGSKGVAGHTGAQRLTTLTEDLQTVRNAIDGARDRSGPLHHALRAVQRLQVHTANGLALNDAGVEARDALTRAADFHRPASVVPVSTLETPAWHALLDLGPGRGVAQTALDANSQQVSRNNAWWMQPLRNT